jgi:hypothetical protein
MYVIAAGTRIANEAYGPGRGPARKRYLSIGLLSTLMGPPIAPLARVRFPRG